MDAPAIRSAPLRREVGLAGAVLLGLGSIVGTGVFVSIGVAAHVAGPAVVVAIALAALVATCNGLSSARLAATFPVSGGTYEYGNRVLNHWLGFLAGWTFLLAKSASAATAALGCAGYLLVAAGVAPGGWARAGLAVGLALGVTALVAGGVRRSSRANAAIVSITLVSLAAFVAAGAPGALAAGATPFTPLLAAGPAGLLEATALMFVAFTGYGRIATLGEEVRDPARTIPRAVVVTLVASAALYLAVGVVAVALAGAPALAAATGAAGAPGGAGAQAGRPWLAALLAVGAVTAMAGVLLNLVLGLSRVVLAMARRGDAPGALARVDAAGSPRAAVVVVGVVVAGLALVGDVRLTWSFSALSVLVYYAVTNLAALRLPAADLRLPRAVPALGLVACLGLTPWIEPWVLGAGAGAVAVGLVGHAVARARATA
ncbi:MAG: amino acid permease [Planctomycetes bacterium]|nr:amino acid permease [Planctomycetota bacterium]